MASCYQLLLLLSSAVRICFCNHLAPGQDTIISFSLDPPFTNNRYLEVAGNASKTVEAVELTSSSFAGALMNSVGRAYFASEIEFLVDSALVSFSSIFSFRITQFQTDGYLPGAGMAFMIVPDPNIPDNSAGSFMGLTNASLSNEFFAVEFDTSREPSATDPPYDHIGVNVNRVQSMATFELTDTLASLLRSNYTLTAWIEFNSSLQLLEVRLTNLSDRPELPFLRQKVNLSSFVHEKMYAGFSAATGLNFELHEILWWKFSTYRVLEDAHQDDRQYSSNKSRCKRWICRKVAIILLACLGALLLAGAGILYWCLVTIAAAAKRPQKQFQDLPSPVRLFSLRQLRAATRSFSRKELIGSGAFGKVYRGTLPNDGALVAVKLLLEASLESEQQFLAELSVIGRLKHRNLVSLKGWCHDKGKLLLVYEFLLNGSLDKHLFSTNSVLSWEKRHNILKGVAEALAFLHDGWEQRVVHRDIKAANVLLDTNFNAKLGDFGLARLMEHSTGPQSMTRAGTAGYIAPELAYMGRATEKSDVYSFGILSLEVATGSRALGKHTEFDEEGQLLLDWVWQMHERGRLPEVVDVKLKKEYDEGQMITLLYLALHCCHPDPSDRPTMRKCWQMLNGDVAPVTPRSYRPITTYYYPDTPLISSNSNGESQ